EVPSVALARSACQFVEDRRERVSLCLVGRSRGVLMQPRRQLVQRDSSIAAGQLLDSRQLSPNVVDAGQPIVSRQLIEVRARQHETGWPNKALLILRVHVLEADGLRGIDLVLR